MLLPESLDHIVIAVPDLARSVEQFSEVLGARPVLGGVHPGRGTANALVRLDARNGDGTGPEAQPRRMYLELLGPDPDQDPALAAALLGAESEPYVQRWAIHPADFDGLVERASKEPGVDLGGVFDMSRTTANGQTLDWRLTRRTPLGLGGIQPFLIDWIDSAHPSAGDLPTVVLTRFWAETTDRDSARRILSRLGASIDLEEGDDDVLHLELDGPGGSWTL